MVTIIDYNMGNIASIQNMLKKIGYDSIVTSDPIVLKNAEKIILPGVGAFDYGVKNLCDLGLIEVLKEKAITHHTPLLGICLGMQLLTEDSEEGKLKGLGLINAHTKRFTSEVCGKENKIPHMGWNYVYPKVETPLFKEASTQMRFYFVHSYYVECEDQNDIIAATEYGKPFTCAIGRDNIYGVQFHPEKSHKYGMNLLKNFVELV